MPQQEGETDYKYEDYASEMGTGAIANTPAGALIKKLSMAFYPLHMEPI